MVTKGAVLALYEVENSDSQVKLKSTASGIVDKIFVEPGMSADPGTALVTLRHQEFGGCTHPTVMKDMCADCGADLRREPGIAGDRKEATTASVAMVHNIPELIVSQEQALELGREDEQRLLKTRKLVLLVDLDQTLIHTTNDNIPPNLKDVYHFQMWQGPHQTWYHTKLRPFTCQFLERISKMYELHICTFGVRLYAHTVARLIDPDEKFFSHRILSRDECFDPQSKTANLKALFPCGDSMVCIIDDREDVWNNAPNLVHVKPYRFFQGTADINAPPGLDKTENDNIPIVHKVIDHHEDHSTETKEKAAETNGTDNPSGGVSAEKTASGGGEGEMQGSGSDNKKTPDSELENQKDTVSKAEADESLESLKPVDEDSDKAAVKPTSQDSESDKQDPTPTQAAARQSSLKTEPANVPTGDASKAGLDAGSGEYPNETSGQSEKMTAEQLAQDLSVSSDSDSGDGDENSSAPMDTEEGTMTESKQLKQDVEGNKVKDTETATAKSAPDASKKESAKDGTVESVEAAKQIGSGKKEDAPLKGEVKDDGEEEIEWVDDDDYLLHLQEILTRIHQAYYGMVDEGKKQVSGEASPNSRPSLPDLKSLIPYVKRKTLKGCNIVFSGVVPLNTPPERSRAYNVARMLGASIQKDIVGPKQANKKHQATTHLVAAKPGTSKHKTAVRIRGVHIVNVNWLWACAERWERCDERLFALGTLPSSEDASPAPDKKERHKQEKRKRKGGGTDTRDSDEGATNGESSGAEKRQKVTAEQGVGRENESRETNMEQYSSAENTEQQSDGEMSHSSERSGASFADTVHPLLAFSDEDLECMDKEVEDFMAEDASDSEDEDDEDRDERIRSSVLGSHSETGSSSESLSGELPRGWGLRRKSKSSPHSNDDDLDKQKKKELEAETEDTENELSRFQKTVDAFAPDSESNTSFAESVGSVDDEIAEAVEKEFLASL